MQEEFVYHYDKWWWGRSVTIASNGGHGLCEVQFDKSFPDTAFIRGLSVTEDYRGQGIGKMLIEECERFARNNECKYIKLDAERGGWCFEWYKRLGYQVLKRRKYIIEMIKTV